MYPLRNMVKKPNAPFKDDHCVRHATRASAIPMKCIWNKPHKLAANCMPDEHVEMTMLRAFLPLA